MAPAETADARVNSDLRTGRFLCPACYDALGQRPQPIDRVIIAPHLEPRAATARLSSSSGSAFSFAPLSPQQRRDRLALVVADVARVKRFDVTVGGLSRSQLMSKLCSRDVRLNTHAETLLGGIDFTQRAPLTVAVTERTVIELGFPTGATLPQVFEAAQHQGLLLCPVETGPYLRIALHEQEVSPNSVMSRGGAPAGALTVAAPALHHDHEYPKGF